MLTTPELTRADVVEVFALWQQRMRLTHWKLSFVFDEAPITGSWADVTCEDAYDEAKVRIAAGFEGWGRDELNVIAAHELVHVLMRDLDVAVQSAEKQIRPAALVEWWLDRYTHEAEGVVERVAQLLVDLAGAV